MASDRKQFLVYNKVSHDLNDDRIQDCLLFTKDMQEVLCEELNKTASGRVKSSTCYNQITQ